MLCPAPLSQPISITSSTKEDVDITNNKPLITNNMVLPEFESSTAHVANISQEMRAISSNPEVIQYAPGRTPLMLIHDGGGTAFAYYVLGDLDRTVVSIHCPGLKEGKGIVSVLQAANDYAAIAREYLNQNCPGQSKLLIGGWSLGGTISLTMAAMFPDLVAGVVTMDTTPPGVDASGLQISVEEHSWSRTDGMHGLVRRQLRLNTRAAFSNLEYATIIRDHHVNVPVFAICAADSFEPPESHQLPQLAEVTWKALLRERLLGARMVPGNHWTMFNPKNAKTTTEALKQGVDIIERWLSKAGRLGST
jgi:pimeloyl-ACP methyl ester carboxylesterase